MPSTATERAHRRRPLRAAFAILGALVALVLVAVIALVLANPSALAERIKERALPQLSQQLGRQVQAGPVSIGWFPVRAELRDLQVAGGPSEPRLLSAGSVAVHPKLWPLIRSRGQDIQVSRIELRNVEVNLVRKRDGTWSLPEPAQSAPQPAQPAPQRQVAIGEVTLENGAIHVYQQGEGDTPDPVLALTQIGFTAHDVAPGRPVQLAAQAAFAADRPNLQAALTLDPLPQDGADLRAHPPKIEGQLSLANADLSKLAELMPAQARALIRGGVLSFSSKLSTTGAGIYAAQGSAKLDKLSIRNQPASGSLNWSARVPITSEAISAKVDHLQLSGPGIQMGGSLSLQAQPRQIHFDLAGPLLDTDALLAVLPANPEPRPMGLSASVRRELEATRVSGTLALDKVVAHKVAATDLRAQAKLEKGVLVLEQGRAQLYGGVVVLDGTQIDLTKPAPSWALQAQLQNTDLGLAMQQVTGEQPVTGKLNGKLALKGEGSVWSQLRENLTGQGALTLAHGALAHTDLSAQLAKPLQGALASLGAGGMGKAAAAAAGGTPLQNVGLGFQVRDGALELDKPIQVASNFGTLALSGRIGLDQKLDLRGTASLAPGFVAQVSGANFAPKKPVDLPLQIGGTLTRPAVQPRLEPAQLATQLAGSSKAGQAAEKGINTLKDQVQRKARQGLGHFLRP